MSDQLENTVNQVPGMTDDKNTESVKATVLVIYALQAASFIVGITFLVAVIINYVKKDDAKGTWLESHFKWQIRTFWYSLLWTFLGILTMYFVIGFFIFFADMVWVIYRIAKGWLRHSEGKEMYS